MNSILVDRPDPAVRVITINRPAKLNACNLEAWGRLADAFQGLAGDRLVRLAVLTGAGGNFSAGDDINAYAAVRADEVKATVYRRAIGQAHAAIETAPFPVIAAINGVCVGGGCSIALCCDFRVANAKARVGIPAAKLGLAYSLEHCQRLTALVGLSNARRILYTGDIFDAKEADTMGFFDRMVDGDALPAAIEFGATMTANAPLSIAASKASLTAIARGQAETHRAAIEATFRRVDASRDAAEGARAFAEKRRPRFSGE